MGAHSIDTKIPWCTHEELKDKFQDLRESDRHEFGTDPYSGSWNTINYVHPHEGKVFTNEQEASDYCLEHAQKWDFAVAVPLVTLAYTPAAQAKIDAAKAKVDSFNKETLYPLEGREMRPCNWSGGKATAWYPTEPAWESQIRKEILARAKAGSAKFKKCGKCGSTLNVSLLVSVECPLCHDHFLVTATDQKAMDRRKAKIGDAKAKLAILEEGVKKAEAEAKKTAKENGRCWYIAGFAAC